MHTITNELPTDLVVRLHAHGHINHLARRDGVLTHER